MREFGHSKAAAKRRGSKDINAKKDPIPDNDACTEQVYYPASMVRTATAPSQGRVCFFTVRIMPASSSMELRGRWDKTKVCTEYHESLKKEIQVNGRLHGVLGFSFCVVCRSSWYSDGSSYFANSMTASSTRNRVIVYSLTFHIPHHCPFQRPRILVIHSHQGPWDRSGTIINPFPL